MNIKNLLNYILDRASENSTWRGLILLTTSAGVALKPEQAEAIIAAGLSVVGVINVFRKQPPKPSRFEAQEPGNFKRESQP